MQLQKHSTSGFSDNQKMQPHSPLFPAYASGPGSVCKAQELFLSSYFILTPPSVTTQSKLTPVCSKRKPLLSCLGPHLTLLPVLKALICHFSVPLMITLWKPNQTTKSFPPCFLQNLSENRSWTLSTYYHKENPLLSCTTAIAEVKASRTTQSLHFVLTNCHRDDNPDLWHPQRTLSLNQDQMATPLSQQTF